MAKDARTPGKREDIDLYMVYNPLYSILSW